MEIEEITKRRIKAPAQSVLVTITPNIKECSLFDRVADDCTKNIIESKKSEMAKIFNDWREATNAKYAKTATEVMLGIELPKPYGLIKNKGE